MSRNGSHEKPYVIGWSRSRIVYRCMVEAEVCEKIARGVLFQGLPANTNARRRAASWGVKNKILGSNERKANPRPNREEDDRHLALLSPDEAEARAKRAVEDFERILKDAEKLERA